MYNSVLQIIITCDLTDVSSKVCPRAVPEIYQLFFSEVLYYLFKYLVKTVFVLRNYIGGDL